MADIRGIQGGQAIPVGITMVEAGVSIPTTIDTSTPLDVDIGSIAAGDNNIGNVDIASIAAGENHIGDVGGAYNTVQATPVLSVAGAYGINDYVGTSGTSIEFANAVRAIGESGLIASAQLIDFALQSKAMELWLFSAPVTPPNDNAAWTLTDADALKCIGVITFNTYYASAVNSVSSADSKPFWFGAVASRSIWGCLVNRVAGTWASGDITVKLNIVQD